MQKITFELDDKKYIADLDELKSYKTSKQFAQGESNPSGMFDAMSRIFLGKDEEYIEGLGGGVDDMGRLCNAAFEAAKLKNS